LNLTLAVNSEKSVAEVSVPRRLVVDWRELMDVPLFVELEEELGLFCEITRGFFCPEHAA